MPMFHSLSKIAFLIALGHRVSGFAASSLGPSLLQDSDHNALPTREATLSTTALHAGGLFGSDDRRESSSSSSALDAGGRFATGNELKRLRADLDNLRENLKWANAMGDEHRIQELSQAVQNGEKRDPDLVYSKALKAVTDAKISRVLKKDEKAKLVEKWTAEATEARKYIARFQLEGLWMGNYGENGQELINVTYSGDTLVATKVTGDSNVPRGKTSFTAELTPTNSSSLDPLKVSFDSEDSGATQLLRYPGKGQVAHFTKSKYVEGQMVMFEKHFSFVWIPTKHHVLFRRPTPEQTIHLLRDVIAYEDELENMRTHVERCFDMDMTESLARFHAKQANEGPLRRISLCSELDEDEKETLEPKQSDPFGRFNFWQVNKWRDYIDRVLGDEQDKKLQ